MITAIHEEKNFDEISIFWSLIFECLYGSGVSQGWSWWVPGGSAAFKTLTRRALSRRVIMLAGACLARSCLARRALDTNFSFNLGWYFEYFSKSDNSKQLVPVWNLYSKILRICWFQGKSNWMFRFWEIQWLLPFMMRKKLMKFWFFEVSYLNVSMGPGCLRDHRGESLVALLP